MNSLNFLPLSDSQKKKHNFLKPVKWREYAEKRSNIKQEKKKKEKQLVMISRL